jgi:NADPH-dependent ferric siderophore reductase
MAQRAPRLVAVERVERLTPNFVRIVFGGPGLADFAADEFSDSYVKLQIPPPGAPYAAPFDPERLRAEHPRELWPRTRTYTVRAWDPGRRELTVDFVVHGDAGYAGPWAEAARPGDLAQLVGPGGGYAPDPDGPWHLMVGDAAVLPAIAASLARVPAGRPVRVLVQLPDAADRLPLESPGELVVEWVEEAGDEALLEALRRLELPAGTPHAFVHGEAAAVRAVRRHLVAELGFPAGSMSASGYWKRSRSDEEWRQDKAEWKRLVAADDAAATPAPAA